MSEYNLMQNLDLNLNYTITNYTPSEFHIGLCLIELKWTAVPWQWNECHSSFFSWYEIVWDIPGLPPLGSGCVAPSL